MNKPKRIFQILDDMNVLDIENKTKLVEVSSNVLAVFAEKTGDGSSVAMKITEEARKDLETGKSIAVLLTIDKKEYERLSKPLILIKHGPNSTTTLKIHT